MDRARPPGRRLSAGNQSHTRSDPRAAPRAGGLLVLLARRQGLFGRRPARQHERSPPSVPPVLHPEFNFENRIAAVEIGDVTVASIYVPNGGKDFPAKMRFLEALDDYARVVRGQRPAAGALRRSERRAHRPDVHPKERKPKAIGQLPEERALIERILGRGLVDVGRALDPGQRRTLHLVGAVAQHAAAQHRLAARLRPRDAAACSRARELSRAGGRRDERPRAGHGDVHIASGCSSRRHEGHEEQFSEEIALRDLRDFVMNESLPES